jgi:hypothetical protein
MMTTRVFEGILGGFQGKFSLLISFPNASTQSHTSVELEPCQSRPYPDVNDTEEACTVIRTQDVLPDGIIVQLRTCRGKASLQKGESKISTPAPSDGCGYFSGEGLTND